MEIKVRYFTKNDSINNGRRNTLKGIMVHSTATPGVMAADWFDRWNVSGLGKSVHAFVDDREAWQYMPWDRRAAHAGGSANDTHISFEICEPTNWQTDAAYFSAAYKNAVELAAELCKEFGLDPEKDIISHAEGYAIGIASNHSDVGHWFPKFNKTMNDFRNDVKRLCDTKEEEDEVRYARFSDIPKWAQPTIKKLMDADILKGTGDGDIIDLSHDMVRILVMNYRGGCFDKQLTAKGLAPAVKE